MTTPNLFITYVSDANRAARFYGELFQMTPAVESPRFIVFDLDGGVQFAVWCAEGYPASPDMPRTSEICLNLPGGPEAIRAQFDAWRQLAVTVIEEPHEAPFGLTFVVADPDGNRIRVAPVD